MTKPLSDKQIDPLIADYLAGSLSDADRPAFERWLAASPDHPRRVARLAAMDYALREVCQDTKADYLLDVLKQIDEASGPAQLVTMHQLKAPRHRYQLVAIAGAIAAVLALAITLAFVFSGGPDPAPLATGNTPNDTHEPGPIAPSVATLTAEHGAVWSADSAEGGLKAGSQLRAGDRLTLNAGIARITTNRGAIAILQAPATIELTDNENALLLHTGKLVGICETDASKGFVIKTNQAQITDIGTEFAVEAVENGPTRIQVFRGVVRAHAIGRDQPADEQVVLTAGQAADISLTRGIEDAAFNNMHFTFRRGYSLTGQIKSAEGVGLSLVPGEHESNETMLLIPERASVMLKQPLGVVLPATNLNDSPSPRTLAASTHVESYLVHFDAEEFQGEEKVLMLRAEIRFVRPILGVILDSTLLHQTTGMFGTAHVQYAESDARIGLEDWGDYVTLSQDGKTLRLTLSAKHGSHQGIDQVRVLVAAEGSRNTNESDDTTQ